MSIIHVKTEQEFQEHVVKSKVPVIVDFYADWCPPCRSLGKIFESVIEESNGWNIVKLNCEDDGVKVLAESHKVSGIPAVFFYSEGQIVPQYNFAGFNQAKLLAAVTAAKEIVNKGSK